MSRRDLVDRISALCWNGAHHRCPGWMVVPDHSEFGNLHDDDQSIRCDCGPCAHPEVRSDRHHLEKPQRDAAYELDESRRWMYEKREG